MLTNTNTYGGGTTINAGTLQIGAGGTTGSITGSVTDKGTLAFDRSDTVTFSSAISGNGTVVQEGAGTLVLNTANGFGGGITIDSRHRRVGGLGRRRLSTRSLSMARARW